MFDKFNEEPKVWATLTYTKYYYESKLNLKKKSKYKLNNLIYNK
jgi:hypothetical protein